MHVQHMTSAFDKSSCSFVRLKACDINIIMNGINT